MNATRSTADVQITAIPKDTNCLGLSSAEQEAINQMSTQRQYKKGDLIISEGEYSSNCFHVLQGCVRKYIIKDGEEKTTGFYIEDQSISLNAAGIQSKPSTFFLECLEDTKVIVTSAIKEAAFYKEFPRFENLCRISSELQLAQVQEEYALFMSSTPEERYLNIVNNRIELLHRVPQYQLASYLGIKPESLSRIRKRLASRVQMK